MNKPRVYVDTSVFGGTRDAMFAEASRRFFELLREGKYRLLVSQITLAELAVAPDEVRAVHAALPEGCTREVPLDEEVSELAQDYINAGVLTEAHRADAMHVAAATVSRADLMLSWNFRHIVNYERIRRFSGVNVMNGYHPLEIRSPLEIVYGEEGEEPPETPAAS